jgi:membrane-associated phospholipid phosphatase
MATYMMVIYIVQIPPLFAATDPFRLVVVVFINTFFFPAWAIFIMRKLGLVESIEMRDSKERIIPMIGAMTFYLWAFMVVKKMHLPSGMVLFVLGAVITLFLCFFINIFHKLSLHMAGISGLVIALLIHMFVLGFDFRLPLVLAVLLVGVIAWARLVLDAHSPTQLYAGFLVGAISQVIALMMFPLFN